MRSVNHLPEHVYSGLFYSCMNPDGKLLTILTFSCNREFAVFFLFKVKIQNLYTSFLIKYVLYI